MKWCIERATGAGRQVPDDYEATEQEIVKDMALVVEPEEEEEEESEEEEEEESEEEEE